MQLLQAPRSPFCIKVRLAIHELGFAQAVRIVNVDPWRDETLRTHNPLCMVPTLLLSDGTALCDSRSICLYLDEVAGNRLLPAAGPSRWRLLHRHALGDGIAEAVIRRHQVLTVDAGERAPIIAARKQAAIAATLDVLDQDPGAGAEPMDFGSIAVCAALVYLSFRSPEIAWRDGRARLARWFDALAARPSAAAAEILPMLAQQA